MPDLQDQPTAPNTPPADGGDVPLAGLFHMSTTAGVGTQDYVAINSIAVLSLFLGLASVLSFLSAIFLLLAAAGVVFGIIAIIQVRNSNKTQSGIALAALGVILSLGIGGGRAGYQGLHRARVAADEKQVADLMTKLGTLVDTEKYDDAYAMFDERFKERVSAEQFAAAWRHFVSDPASGTLKAITWNNEAMNIEEQGDTVYASGMALFQFEKDKEARRSVIDFQKTDDKWQVHNIDAVFPTRRK